MIKIIALIVAVFALFSLLDDHDELAVLEQEHMSRYDRCWQQFGDVAEYRHLCYKYHVFENKDF
jgi:hypothetical protein